MMVGEGVLLLWWWVVGSKVRTLCSFHCLIPEQNKTTSSPPPKQTNKHKNKTLNQLCEKNQESLQRPPVLATALLPVKSFGSFPHRTSRPLRIRPERRHWDRPFSSSFIERPLLSTFLPHLSSAAVSGAYTRLARKEPWVQWRLSPGRSLQSLPPPWVPSPTLSQCICPGNNSPREGKHSAFLGTRAMVTSEKRTNNPFSGWASSVEVGSRVGEWLQG